MKNKELNLTDFYQRKKNAEASFNIEYLLLSGKILDLVPKELESFKGWQLVRDYRLVLPICTIYASDLGRYNFRSLPDAEKKINKLKKAWDGIINVTILTDSKYKTMNKRDYHLEVRFSF